MTTRRDVLSLLVGAAALCPPATAAAGTVHDGEDYTDRAAALARRMQQLTGAKWAVTCDHDFILIARQY
jgi:hypothetical protein